MYNKILPKKNPQTPNQPETNTTPSHHIPTTIRNSQNVTPQSHLTPAHQNRTQPQNIQMAP
ncbi:hypothetical protein BDV40DRAFT_265961 [Aspergillus tamarii]|uniref:Uncharacterized protein n=1 Tax=Aspergillus tamarii TaxID=41984 RepID=A0A5N6UTY2_ASPTM|nr:hypothetical protein BDV40DRAFT_265961 [Aspergillus tamarii]